jgi:hypothetical protein
VTGGDVCNSVWYAQAGQRCAQLIRQDGIAFSHLGLRQVGLETSHEHDGHERKDGQDQPAFRVGDCERVKRRDEEIIKDASSKKIFLRLTD